MSETVVYTLASLHQDHQRWRHDHTAWQEDVEHWMSQYAAMRSDLGMIGEALKIHGTVLQEHGGSVREGETRIANHERALTDFTQRGTGAELTEELVHGHQAHAKDHGDNAQAHEHLKAHHDRVVAAVATLKAELTSPSWTGR